MLDRDQMKELHNSVTELHKTTSLAATGSGAIDWGGVLDLTINILTLIKNNFSTMENELRRGAVQSINEKSETQQKEHEEALSRTAQPRHPNTPQRAGFAENITETVKGNPPNPPLKTEGSPPEKSPVNNQNDPKNPNLNKIEQTKNEPPEKIEPKPTDLTLNKSPEKK